MLFKFLNLNSNLALTLGYLNLALNNWVPVFYKWYYSNPFRFSETFSSPGQYHYFPTNAKLLWKGSNPGGRGERGLICEASILFWREIGSPPKLGRWHSLVVSNGGSNRLTTTKTTSTSGCILNAKKSMLSEQAVKSWPLEKYAKFVAPKETSSTHKQGYWKVCMLRIFKSKNLLCRRRVCGWNIKIQK